MGVSMKKISHGEVGPASLDLLYASLWVPELGYYWDAEAKPTPFALGGSSPPFLMPRRGKQEERRIAPLNSSFDEASDLLKAFRDLDLTKESIERFAKRFGWLGMPTRLLPAKRPGKERYGESLSLWQREIQEFRAAYDLWDMLDDLRSLKQCLDWREGAVFFKSRESELQLVTTTGALRPKERLYKRVASRDARATGKLILLDICNCKLATNVSLRLQFDSELRLIGRIIPRGVHGVVWLQLFQAITQRTWRKCEVCGEYMNVSQSPRPGARRVHTKCGKARRMANYRKRLGNQEVVKRV